jgi:hypothetical protein
MTRENYQILNNSNGYLLSLMSDDGALVCQPRRDPVLVPPDCLRKVKIKIKVLVWISFSFRLNHPVLSIIEGLLLSIFVTGL